MPFTDEEILAQFKHPESKEKAFRNLLINYQERLYYVIKHIVESHDDTDDLLQNTFIKAYRNIDRFESRSSLFTWLYRIATNEALSFKKSKMRKGIVPITESGSYQLATVENDHQESEVLERLQKAINELPVRQKQVFEMRYYQELSYDQMSSILSLTTGALKASYHHAVKKIEEYIINTTTL